MEVEKIIFNLADMEEVRFLDLKIDRLISVTSVEKGLLYTFDTDHKQTYMQFYTSTNQWRMLVTKV